MPTSFLGHISGWLVDHAVSPHPVYRASSDKRRGRRRAPAPPILLHLFRFKHEGVYPVQLKTLLNPETSGTFFKDKVVRVAEGVKVNCVQWDTSPNHIKYRMDIDRDGLLFREVLQFIRNGKRTSIPEEKYRLQQLVCEAEFFGLELYRYMLRRRLWKLTGKAAFYACYSDSD